MVRAMANTTMLTKNTRETALLLQPNSLITGLNITPNAYCAPE